MFWRTTKNEHIVGRDILEINGNKNQEHKFNCKSLYFVPYVPLGLMSKINWSFIYLLLPFPFFNINGYVLILNKVVV